MSIIITFPILFALVFVICVVGWLRAVNKAADGGGYFGGFDLVRLLFSFLWWIPVLVMIGVAIGRCFR